MRRFAFICLFLFSILALSTPAQAASPRGSLEVSPVFTEIALEKPDQTKQIVFSYKNNSSQPITLQLFPIDFRQSDLNGTIDFVGAESGTFSYSLASFLSFESNTLQLEAGEKKDFLVTVTNREDLSPGGHYAAVVARLESPEKSEVGQAQVSPSVSSLILLRKVGGERFNISLSDLEFPNGPVVFSYPLRITAVFNNEGNIHLVPFGTAEIRDMFGRQIYKGVINTASLRVFPETRRYIQIDMNKTGWSLPLSLNTIIVQGNDSLQKVTYGYKDTFLYINVAFFVVLVIILLAAFFLKKKLIRKRQRKQKS